MDEALKLPLKTIPDGVGTVSDEEDYAHILRGLISYHERMTMGMYPERDCYTKALRYALGLVEREIKTSALLLSTSDGGDEHG